MFFHYHVRRFRHIAHFFRDKLLDPASLCQHRRSPCHFVKGGNTIPYYSFLVNRLFLRYNKGIMSTSLYPIKLYLKKRPNLIMLSLGLLLNIALWLWLRIHIGSDTQQVFLHYNILFGVDLIGPWFKIFYLPMTGLAIFLFNGILAWLLFPRDRFASYVLNVISVLCQILLFVAGWLLVYLNV